MTDNLLKTKIQDINLEINELIALTEDVYGMIIETIPTLEEELLDMMIDIDKSEEDLFLALGPIKELMVKIQIQDIVRQGLENIDRCLSTILADETRADRRYQELLVNQKVIELAANLLVNMWDKLIQSLQEIDLLTNDLLVNIKSLIKSRTENVNDSSRILAIELHVRMRFEINNLQKTYHKLEDLLREINKAMQSQVKFDLILADLHKQIKNISQELDAEIQAGACSSEDVASGLETVSQELQGLVTYLRTHSELVVAKLLLEDEELDVGSGGELVLF